MVGRHVCVALLALRIATVGVQAAERSSRLVDISIRARDGQVLKLADYRGRWLLINYWATWCADCLEEFPVLSRMSSMANLTILGLSDEKISAQKWASFRSAHPLPYQTALVDREALPTQLPASAYFLEMRPISYLIAPNGSVARRFLGSVSQSEVEKAMRAWPE